MDENKGLPQMELFPKKKPYQVEAKPEPKENEIKKITQEDFDFVMSCINPEDEPFLIVVDRGYSGETRVIVHFYFWRNEGIAHEMQTFVGYHKQEVWELNKKYPFQGMNPIWSRDNDEEELLSRYKKTRDRTEGEGVSEA